MIRTGKKFSKPEMSRVINGDSWLPDAPEKPDLVRLDVLMTEVFKSYTRATLQKFIRNGFVTVDGKIITKPNAQILRGVRVELKIPEEMKHADVEPEVIYEDEDVLVLNKPAGILSEAKGEYCPEKTLADFGLVAHRLDRDTSGVIILAKNEVTRDFLKKQFQDRTTKKTYFAVVLGRPKLDEARIDLPMKRDLKRPTTFRVDPGGKEAETFYRVVDAGDKYSLVELRPTTGRTHQLRVHMKYLGHPILGDAVYGDGGEGRLFLHANKLEIELPSGERKVFEAKLPREFVDVLR